MPNALVEVPRTALWAAESGGRFARTIGEGFIGRLPGRVPPGVVAQQAIFKEFEHRFAVVDLDDPQKDPEIEAYMAVDALVEKSKVDQLTAVELRLALPEDLLKDGVLNKRRERAIELLQLALEEDNVMSIFNSEPIMPSKRETSPMDARAAWQAFAPELDGLAHQFDGDSEYDPAMLAITEPAYERAMFGGHAVIQGSPRGSNLLALDSVGRRPEENVLTWLRPPAAHAA